MGCCNTVPAGGGEQAVQSAFVKGEIQADKGRKPGLDLLHFYHATVVVDTCILGVGGLIGMFKEDPLSDPAEWRDLLDPIPTKCPVDRRQYAPDLTGDEVQRFESFPERGCQCL